MSYFQNLHKSRSQYPWGRSTEEFRAVGVELQDRKSLFYADCAKLLWASASGLLWTSFIQILKRRHLVSYLLFEYMNSFTIILKQKPIEFLRSRRKITILREPVLRRLCKTPLGFCLRIIAWTSFIQILKSRHLVSMSVILINLCFFQTNIYLKEQQQVSNYDFK